MDAQKLYPGFSNPLLGAPKGYSLPQHMAVIGAGTIGPDIGYYLKSSLPDARLTLIDIDEAPLAAAAKRYEAYARKGVERGKMSEEKAAGVLENIVLSTDYDALEGVDLVIEAASESILTKKKIFSLVEERVSPRAIIGSNTSSIPASVMFADVEHPGRTCITHFFSPAWRNPGVELVKWEKGDRAVLDYLRWFFCSTGKTPVVVDDVVAFVFSRIFDNWCNEAALLLDTATAAQIDKVAEEFVHAGPFFVLNLSHGNPIIVEANERQVEAEGEHYSPAHIFNSVQTWNIPKPGSEVHVPADTARPVRDRLLGILFSQTLDSVARDLGTPEDINLICCLALGFKRGPLDIMAQLGTAEVERMLHELNRARPGLPSAELIPTVSEALAFRRHILVDRLLDSAAGGDRGAGDVIVLTIRRPAQLNALTDEVLDEILAAIKEFEKEPSVAGFVLTGYGTRAFCSGADIGHLPEMLGDFGAFEQYARDCSRLLEYMDGMSKPVVAAVNGLALGGGAELAIRCHDRVASPHAVFQFPEVNLGLLPGIGGLVIPYRKWPHAAETFDRMLRTGEKLPASSALEIGVVSESVDEYEALVNLAARRVRQLVGSLPLAYPSSDDLAHRVVPGQSPTEGASLPREIVRIITEAIGEGAQAPDIQSALQVGYRAFGRVATTRAAREGIAAFLEGRRPNFEGM